MPTIEVEDSDQVFVVKGRGSASGGYHELGPNDLLIVAQVVAGDGEVIDLIPYARVYMGGTRVSGFEGFTFSMDNEATPSTIEFKFPENWSGHHVVGLVRRLHPFVTVRYSGASGLPQAIKSGPPVERVSRYNRSPVI